MEDGGEGGHLFSGFLFFFLFRRGWRSGEITMRKGWGGKRFYILLLLVVRKVYKGLLTWNMQAGNSFLGGRFYGGLVRMKGSKLHGVS